MEASVIADFPPKQLSFSRHMNARTPVSRLGASWRHFACPLWAAAIFGVVALTAGHWAFGRFKVLTKDWQSVTACTFGSDSFHKRYAREAKNPPPSRSLGVVK